MRLLHPGHGHGRRRPVPPQPRPDGPPDRRGHPRQRLPLHRLQAHPGGHQARRRYPAWRREDRPGRGARRRLRRGQADLPRGRPQEGPGLWPVPGRHHREGLPGHVLRLGRALQVRPRPRGQDRLIQGRGHGGRHWRAHGRRRAPQPGGPPHPGLGRHDRRGRRHPLHWRRRLPGGCRDARDSGEGQEGRQGHLGGARARPQHRGGPRRGRPAHPRQLLRLWQHGPAQGQRLPEPSRHTRRRQDRPGKRRPQGHPHLHHALHRARLPGARVLRGHAVQGRREDHVHRPGRLRHAQGVRAHVWLGRRARARRRPDHARGRRLRRQGGRLLPAPGGARGVQVRPHGEVPLLSPGVAQLPPQAPLHGGHLHPGLRRGGQLRRPGLRDQLRHGRLRLPVRTRPGARLHALCGPLQVPEHRHPRLRLLHQQPARGRLPRLWRVPVRVCPRVPHRRPCRGGGPRPVGDSLQERHRAGRGAAQRSDRGLLHGPQGDPRGREGRLLRQPGPRGHRLLHEERGRGRGPARRRPLQHPRGGRPRRHLRRHLRHRPGLQHRFLPGRGRGLRAAAVPHRQRRGLHRGRPRLRHHLWLAPDRRHRRGRPRRRLPAARRHAQGREGGGRARGARERQGRRRHPHLRRRHRLRGPSRAAHARPRRPPGRSRGRARGARGPRVLLRVPGAHRQAGRRRAQPQEPHLLRLCHARGHPGRRGQGL